MSLMCIISAYGWNSRVDMTGAINAGILREDVRKAELKDDKVDDNDDDNWDDGK